MNIFILDKDPVIAAQLQCDKHVVKMILESAQIMSTVANRYGVAAKYKPTHSKHPCTLWAGNSRQNYEWLSLHALALSEEYTFRYGKKHKSQEVIENLLSVDRYIPEYCTDFVQCMPEEFKDKDVVQAYRKYYNSKTFAKWTKREVPYWYKGGDNT